MFDRRQLTGPAISGAEYDRLTGAEKDKAKSLHEQREKNPIFWRAQRDRRGYAWSGKLLEKTKDEAKARKTKLITAKWSAGQLFDALADVYGRANLPDSAGLLINNRAFRTSAFPDHNVLNTIPPIWNINQVSRGPKKGKESEWKKSLSQLFNLGNIGLTVGPEE